ncbi:MAG: ATP-binding protein [Desulfuromonadales bacterium]
MDGATRRSDGVKFGNADSEETEPALRESEQKFRAIFQTNPSLMLVTTIEGGRILDVNRSFETTTGYSRREVLGKTLNELNLWPEDGHDRLKHLLLTRGSFQNEEIRIKSRSGNLTTLQLSTEILESGGEKCLISSALDITALRASREELVKAKEAAEAANCAKSEFLANMSHEIRTPMTVFMAAIDHLQRIDRDPEHRRVLDMAEQSAQRLVLLIDDILDLSRIEARRLEIEEIPFAPQTCTETIIEMMQIKAREKNLRLGLEVSSKVPRQMLGDPNRIGQVLTNLIDNALKFTEAGEVHVSIGVRNENLAFAVSDTGIGIPEEKKDLLFKNFSQLDGSLTRRYGGTGLGLAICKGLVELMGGKIGVQNREGGGSVFSFFLPLKKTETGASVLDTMPVEAVADTGEPGLRILLVDDEPMVRNILLLALGRCGWRAETAENGREAVDKWKNGDFDLILMDLQMPELTGIEATREIRALERNRSKRTRIVGITAYALREVKEECLAAGMENVMTKPLKLKELEAIVDSCLAERLDSCLAERLEIL